MCAYSSFGKIYRLFGTRTWYGYECPIRNGVCLFACLLAFYHIFEFYLCCELCGGGNDARSFSLLSVCTCENDTNVSNIVLFWDGALKSTHKSYFNNISSFPNHLHLLKLDTDTFWFYFLLPGRSNDDLWFERNRFRDNYNIIRKSFITIIVSALSFEMRYLVRRFFWHFFSSPITPFNILDWDH